MVTQVGHQPGRDRQARHGQFAALGQRLQPLAHLADALAAGLEPVRPRVGRLPLAGQRRDRHAAACRRDRVAGARQRQPVIIVGRRDRARRVLDAADPECVA